MRESIISVLENPYFLVTWAAAVGVSLAVLARDLARYNAQMAGLMRFVWVFTVLYSGPVGLLMYYLTGRAQIGDDALWKRGFRSTAHCYSGCGMGEVAGVFVAAGLLSLSTWWVAGVTFTLAYVAGFALTVGPLMQDGVPFPTALKDAFVAETASITVMEVTAIGLDLWLARDATMGEPLFWAALVLSLTAGLAAAYPVNVLLIALGVKGGMHHPAAMHGQ